MRNHAETGESSPAYAKAKVRNISEAVAMMLSENDFADHIPT